MELPEEIGDMEKQLEEFTRRAQETTQLLEQKKKTHREEVRETLEKREAELQQQMEHDRKERMRLRDAIIKKNQQAKSDTKATMEAQEEEWHLEREHQLEEIAMRRLKLEEIQSKRHELDTAVNSRCTVLEEIDAESSRRGTSQVERMQHLLERADHLKEELALGTDNEQVRLARELFENNNESDADQAFLIANEIEAARRARFQKALNERQQEQRQLNVQRRELHNQQREIAKRKKEQLLIEAEGLEFMASIELGDAPPKALIVKNLMMRHRQEKKERRREARVARGDDGDSGDEDSSSSSSEDEDDATGIKDVPTVLMEMERDMPELEQRLATLQAQGVRQQKIERRFGKGRWEGTGCELPYDRSLSKETYIKTAKGRHAHTLVMAIVLESIVEAAIAAIFSERSRDDLLLEQRRLEEEKQSHLVDLETARQQTAMRRVWQAMLEEAVVDTAREVIYELLQAQEYSVGIVRSCLLLSAISAANGPPHSSAPAARAAAAGGGGELRKRGLLQTAVQEMVLLRERADKRDRVRLQQVCAEIEADMKCDGVRLGSAPHRISQKFVPVMPPLPPQKLSQSPTNKRKKKQAEQEEPVESSSSSDEEEDELKVVSVRVELPPLVTAQCYSNIGGAAERTAELRYWRQVRLRPYPFDRDGSRSAAGKSRGRRVSGARPGGGVQPALSLAVGGSGSGGKSESVNGKWTKGMTDCRVLEPSLDGRYLAGGSSEGLLAVWCLPDERRLRGAREAAKEAGRGDGATVAQVTAEEYKEREVTLLRYMGTGATGTGTGSEPPQHMKSMQQQTGVRPGVAMIRWSANSSRLAVLYDDGLVWVWGMGASGGLDRKVQQPQPGPLSLYFALGPMNLRREGGDGDLTSLGGGEAAKLVAGVRDKRQRDRLLQEETNEAMRRLEVACACFHPAMTIAGEQPDLVVGTRGGTALKWNSWHNQTGPGGVAKSAAIVRGRSCAATDVPDPGSGFSYDPSIDMSAFDAAAVKLVLAANLRRVRASAVNSRASVTDDGVGSALSSLKMAPIKREFFLSRGHARRAPVCFMCYTQTKHVEGEAAMAQGEVHRDASMTMVTVDEASVLRLWPYRGSSYSGFGWFVPALAVQLDFDSDTLVSRSDEDDARVLFPSGRAESMTAEQKARERVEAVRLLEEEVASTLEDRPWACYIRDGRTMVVVRQECAQGRSAAQTQTLHVTEYKHTEGLALDGTDLRGVAVPPVVGGMGMVLVRYTTQKANRVGGGAGKQKPTATVGTLVGAALAPIATAGGVGGGGGGSEMGERELLCLALYPWQPLRGGLTLKMFGLHLDGSSSSGMPCFSPATIVADYACPSPPPAPPTDGGIGGEEQPPQPTDAAIFAYGVPSMAISSANSLTGGPCVFILWMGQVRVFSRATLQEVLRVQLPGETVEAHALARTVAAKRERTALDRRKQGAKQRAVMLADARKRQGKAAKAKAKSKAADAKLPPRRNGMRVTAGGGACGGMCVAVSARNDYVAVGGVGVAEIMLLRWEDSNSEQQRNTARASLAPVKDAWRGAPVEMYRGTGMLCDPRGNERDIGSLLLASSSSDPSGRRLVTGPVSEKAGESSLAEVMFTNGVRSVEKSQSQEAGGGEEKEAVNPGR
jgi:hypothetical protein